MTEPFEVKQYKGYSYRFYSPKKCVVFLPFKARVQGCVGTEKLLLAFFDMLVLAEENGLNPASCGLDEELIKMLSSN